MANLPFIDASKLSELLRHANKRGNLKAVLAANQLQLGTDPLNPTLTIDFSSEEIVPIRSLAGSPAPSTTTFVSDAPGKYQIECDGNVFSFRSLKEALKAGLALLEKSRPGTLEKLSKIKPYSKRIVARNRTDLFDSKHLVEDFSEKLGDDWWIGTNNSTQEVRAWLERATQCADLQWGRDFKVRF